MARELGFRPKSLIKNIPSPSQQWKAPVKDWIRSLYLEKTGNRRPLPAAEGAPNASGAGVLESKNPDDPWPDRPEIPAIPLAPPDFDDCMSDFEEAWFLRKSQPPSEDEVAEEDARMLRRQRLFRWAAQSIAVAMSGLPEVQRVAAFGAVSRPLKKEIPRFREYRRRRIEILHECADLDVALWLTSPDQLRDLKKALNRGLSAVRETAYGGVAHHQVDVHLFDAATGGCSGRLCILGMCPKPGKRECRVRHCGASPFLRRFPLYEFNASRFEAEPRVLLFERASGFLVPMPRIEVEPERQIRWHDETNVTDDDVPF